MNLQCRLIDQEKACDECEYGGTALLCFEFRPEHLVDQILNCEKLIMTRIHQNIRANYRYGGVRPRVLRWKVPSKSRHVSILFSDRQDPPPLDTMHILGMMKADPWHYSWLFHNGWVKAFFHVVDAANQYRNTKSREVSLFQP